MKPENEMDDLFKGLENQWDEEEPEFGHQQRFLSKLESNGTPRNKNSNITVWKYVSIAASLAVLITIGVQFIQKQQPQTPTIEQKVATKPTKVQRTEFYFTALINQEIEKINTISSPKTKKLVDDLKRQLTRLENDYKVLETDLNTKGDVKQILNAMIINFQTRINLAQDMLNKIKEIEQLKNTKDEEHTI